MVLLQNRLGPHTKKRRKKEKKTTLRQSTCHGADMQELESGTEGEAEGGGKGGSDKRVKEKAHFVLGANSAWRAREDTYVR